MIRGLGAVVAAAAATGLACLAAPVVSEGASRTEPVVRPVSDLTMTRQPAARDASALPLAGIRIALDPGHQLGNRNFPAKINALTPAGGFSKPCNTTGTTTSGGYPEASLTFAIALSVRKRLQDLGAQVFLTRTKNSESLWGPCVNIRGAYGAKVAARLAVSLHADGAASSAHGFHVIAPASRSPWTADIADDSHRLALALRAGLDALGLPRANYLGGGTGLVTRSDLGTLNLSDVPIVMVEVGNMRNAGDAARMTTYAGRTSYAVAVVDGIRRYLSR